MENEITKKIIGAAIEVHRELGGPGLLESIYEMALFQELLLQGLQPKRQVCVPVKYKGQIIKDHLCLDLLVNDKIIVEVKAVEKENPLHKNQLLTYLRLTDLKLGLLINFGNATLVQGINRIVNNRKDL